MKQRTRSGFTLVEILIAMGITGLILTLVVQVSNTQTRANTIILSYSDLSNDIRMATVRMTELISQAAYIYPSGQTINLPSGNITTGPQALAFLLASGTPYCTATTNRYCAVVYRVEARTPYAPVLGASTTASPFVVTERIFTSLDWPQSLGGNLPPKNWTALTPGPIGLVADAVNNATTNLSKNMVVSSRQGPYDSSLQPNVTASTANALIVAVSPSLTLQLNEANRRPIQREFSIYAQPVPRQGPLDN